MPCFAPDSSVTDLPFTLRQPYRTSNLSEAEAHLSGFLWPHSLALRAGRVQFVHHGARFGHLGIHTVSYGARVRVAIEPRIEALEFQIGLAGEAQITQHNTTIRLSTGEICAVNASARVQIDMNESCRMLVLWVVPDALRRVNMGRAYPRGFQLRPLNLANCAPNLARLLDNIVCADLNASTNELNDPLVRTPLEQTLYALLLRLTQTQVDTHPEDVPIPSYLRCALAYARARLTDDIDLTGLACIAGVSPRTLQLAFRRHFQTTPFAWLREQRLELARAALSAANNPAPSVSAVALGCGFTHLGRFARQYRARYGESPSSTAQRCHLLRKV